MDKAVPGPRVLHVAQPVVDGVAVVVADLAEYLAGQSMQVAVACPAHGYLPDRLRTSGIEHLTWATLLLLVLTRGAGAISVDHLIARAARGR